MTDYPGHLVSKPEISLELVGTLVINERGVSIEGEWGSNEKFALHSSNSETTLFHSKALSFKGSFVWDKTKVVEDGVELSFSHQLNSSNILIEGHGMNKHGLFEISGVGELNEDSTTYEVKLIKTYIISIDTKLWKPRLIDGRREVCLGEVVSFDMESYKIKVLFCRDGDVEHISKDNCIKIASTSAISAPKAEIGQIKVGDNVAKYFSLDKGKVGEIIKCNPESNSVFIRYNEDEEEEEVEMNEAWHLLKECDRVPAAAIPTTSQPTTTSRINFSPIPYANSTHATSVAATKEIVDLCSPESTAREENKTASPDLTILKAKLELAVCKREEAELMLTLAQAKANTGPTKKRADDNTSQRAALSNMSSGGEPKRIKVEEEVKVKIEEEWTP
jgi:hypothetical protein